MDNENKPLIYAHCPAGCEWETVHKEDFIKSATFFKEPIDVNDRCYLIAGNEYKIFSTYDSGWGCSIKLVYTSGGVATEYSFSIPHEDNFAESVVFKLLDKTINAELTTITLTYEMAGVRYTDTINGTNISIDEEEYLYVEDAEEVLLYNYDASYTLYAKDGLSTFACSLNNTTSSTTSIAKNTVTIPSDREIQVGDFVLCADNNMFKVNAVNTNLTVEYLTSINGSQLQDTASWHDDPSDNYVPTEKLVKDSLDEKVDKVTSATVGNIPKFLSGGGLEDSGISANNVSQVDDLWSGSLAYNNSVTVLNITSYKYIKLFFYFVEGTYYNELSTDLFVENNVTRGYSCMGRGSTGANVGTTFFAGGCIDFSNGVILFSNGGYDATNSNSMKMVKILGVK